jgi:hypothetical protein
MLPANMQIKRFPESNALKTHTHYNECHLLLEVTFLHNIVKNVMCQHEHYCVACEINLTRLGIYSLGYL